LLLEQNSRQTQFLHTSPENFGTEDLYKILQNWEKFAEVLKTFKFFNIVMLPPSELPVNSNKLKLGRLHGRFAANDIDGVSNWVSVLDSGLVGPGREVFVS